MVLGMGGVLSAFGPEKGEWIAVNDGVMGGASKGGAERESWCVVVFAGTISLENNGGFCSIRCASREWRMEKGGAVVLRVVGDGRSYWMDLRTSERQGAFSYRQGFNTVKGEEMTIRLPVENFRASAFGRNVWLAAPLNPEKVMSVGFTMYDKKEGPFRLEVLGIEWESSHP